MFGIFRKKDAKELLAEAEALFAGAEFGDAKLAFDRAEDRALKEGQRELAASAAARAADSCDKIAERRIGEARELARSGHLELAQEELKHALDTARSDVVRERVVEAQRALEKRDAQEQAQPTAELSDEERVALISSSWEALQAKELESHGEPLLQGLLALVDGRAAEAVAQLESLIAKAKEPSYLWLELGKARLVHGDVPGATEALRTFLRRIGPEEGGAARVMAHRELARMAHEAGDQEAAIAEFEASAAALEDDPRPYLDLGNYLRLIGRPREAIEVLDMCGNMFVAEGVAVEWPVTMELGLACADAGEAERAERALESVITQLGSGGNTDFPPVAVTALAKIHEARGNLTRAADLYRVLCQGSDSANHASYHLEAARLLDALGLADEASRMRTRAEGLKAPA
jgi:tetratricopeptide (TPR) repeat protein